MLVVPSSPALRSVTTRSTFVMTLCSKVFVTRIDLSIRMDPDNPVDERPLHDTADDKADSSDNANCRR